MMNRPDPAALLQGPLGSWLDQQAVVRDQARVEANERLYKAALFGGVPAAFLMFLLPWPVDFKIMVLVFAGGAAWAWSQVPKRKAVKAVKVGINQAIAEALGLEYSHDVTRKGGFNFAKTYRLLPGFDRASFEDQWCGLTMGHDFCLHEAHLEERQGSGKNSRWVTVYRGAIMTLGCSRRFHGITVVQRHGVHKKLLGGTKDSIRLAGQDLGYCNVVHPGFEDVFDIFSTDPVEARYLVHPAYVEKMLELERAYNGQDVRCLFIEGQVVVTLKTRELFESGSIDAGEDRQRLATTIEQFGKLADLAGALNEWDRTAKAEFAARASQDDGSARKDSADYIAGAAAIAQVAEAAPQALGFGRKTGGFGRKGM